MYCVENKDSIANSLLYCKKQVCYKQDLLNYMNTYPTIVQQSGIIQTASTSTE